MVLAPTRFEDNRGWFRETYNARREQGQGVDVAFVQDNESLSYQPGTVRGIHFQVPPRPQAKLVHCPRGKLIDYVVDLRRGSPTYGRYVEVELSAENGRVLFIPVGFGHAFVTMEPNTAISYKVSDFYAPECDRGLRWNCPEIGIRWPFPDSAITLSSKDTSLPALSEFDSPFAYDGEPLKLVSVS